MPVPWLSVLLSLCRFAACYTSTQSGDALYRNELVPVKTNAMAGNRSAAGEKLAFSRGFSVQGVWAENFSGLAPLWFSSFPK